MAHKIVDLSTILLYNLIERVEKMLLIRNVWLDMKAILRTVRQIINEELKPLNLSSSEGNLLYLLLTGSNKLQQEQLAEQLDVDKAAVSRVVNSSNQKDMLFANVIIMIDAHYICLTNKVALIEDEVKRIYDDLYALVRHDIPDEEVYRIEQLLAQIKNNLRVVED